MPTLAETLANAVVPGNIDLLRRPQVRLPDGSIATVRSMSTDLGNGLETLLPTIGPNGEDLSNQEAIELFRRTGKHLGQFRDVPTADDYAQRLHEEQQLLYAPREKY